MVLEKILIYNYKIYWNIIFIVNRNHFSLDIIFIIYSDLNSWLFVSIRWLFANLEEKLVPYQK